jgi:NAD(P)-dependent dehydrogenase (short-subunit alcohol dehydrogenase family)
MTGLDNLFSLKGRVALVTGGSRGIGRMIAEGFIAQGARVYIVSRKAAVCVETARALGPNAIALPADLATTSGCDELVAAFQDGEPGLDVLVNNAGVAWGAPFETFPESGWDKVMDLNLKSPFFLTQKLTPLLKAAARPDRPAKVINIGSVDGLRPSAWETYSYQASKVALHYLTRAIAARLISDHIHLNAIAPGAFPSALNRQARDDGDQLSKMIPSGRLGDRDDIAAAAIYLAARSGDYVIGHTLTVDGGVTHASLPSENA